nr:microtubule-associated protein 70-1-like [Ipomoea trifida]
MAEVPGERSVTTTEVSYGENGCNLRPATAEATPLQLAMSASFKEGKTAMRRALVRSSLDADEFINLLHGSDRVKVKLNRLENEVRDAIELGVPYSDPLADGPVIQAAATRSP